MRSVVLVVAFLVIIGIFSLGIYSGIIEIKKPQNLLGLISNNSDGFKFVSSVDLEVNLENSSSTQNNNYLFKNNKDNKDNKKIASAPIKTKKSKELSQTIVKVISGAAVNLNNNNVSSSVIASAAVLMASSISPLVLPAVATTSSSVTTSSIENSAPVQIQKIQEKTSEKTQEQNLAQVSQIIQEPVMEKPQTQNQTQNNISPIQENIFNNILISEIMAGADGNSSYEFIELFNPTANAIDLTGWSIKKKSSTGSESTLVSSSRFDGKIIPPNKYFLLANEGGYDSQVSADVFWPKSYTLAYTNNSIVIYNANSELIEEVNWTEISKGQSIERESLGSNQFKTQSSPNPQNSVSN